MYINRTVSKKGGASPRFFLSPNLCPQNWLHKIGSLKYRLDYAVENRDYETVLDQLKNYQTVQKETNQTIVDENITKQLLSSIPDGTDYSMPQPLTPKIDWNEELGNVWRGYPERQKFVLDNGMKLAGATVASDAYEFWKAGLTNFEESADYVEKTVI